MKIKTALIIGASGQDGSYLADFLLTKNYKVVCSSRDADSSNFINHHKLNIHEKVEYVTLNINEFPSILKVIQDYKPNEIYNLAAQSSVGLSFIKPIETIESIIIGTVNILEAIKFSNPKIKFYNAGSSESFGNHGDIKITEKSKLDPISPYGISKAAAYNFVKTYRNSYSIYACTGILFNHESEFRGKNFVTKKIIESAVKIKLGLDNKLVLGNINIYRDWGWAPEYVEAMWKMLQMKVPDDYIIATGETYSLKDFIIYCFQYLGLNYEDFLVTNESLKRPQDIEINRANPSKANKILKWKAKKNMYRLIENLIEIELKNYEN